MRTGIKARTNSNFGHIGPLPTELDILECLNNSPLEKWFLEASSLILYRIFVKLADNLDRHEMSDEFEFWPGRIG